MSNTGLNTQKIINDPVFGFIVIPHSQHFKLIEHPTVQRLKRIKQLGLSHYVYPGAQHTRFQHSLGAMHLMNEAISTLREKKIEISLKEEKAALSAILLHDIGHGPFSHALENSIVPISHEELSLLLMQKLNREFKGTLQLCIDIFTGNYNKPFLRQLVSSQLDMDRMDYLRRDSFFTGVIDGTVGSARIIKMLNVYNNELVVDAKGIYSIEKFLLARRMMYWQVYLHKTAISAENMLIKLLKRAKELTHAGVKLFATSALQFFLENEITKSDFYKQPDLLDIFIQLDDYDITASIKEWQNHTDIILSTLSKGLINRNMFKTEILSNDVDQSKLDDLRSNIIKYFNITEYESEYFVFTHSIESDVRIIYEDQIKILHKNGQVDDIINVSEILNAGSIRHTSKSKRILCHFKL